MSFQGHRTDGVVSKIHQKMSVFEFFKKKNPNETDFVSVKEWRCCSCIPQKASGLAQQFKEIGYNILT